MERLRLAALGLTILVVVGLSITLAWQNGAYNDRGDTIDQLESEKADLTATNRQLSDDVFVKVMQIESLGADIRARDANIEQFLKEISDLRDEKNALGKKLDSAGWLTRYLQERNAALKIEKADLGAAKKALEENTKKASLESGKQYSALRDRLLDSEQSFYLHIERLEEYLAKSSLASGWDGYHVVPIYFYANDRTPELTYLDEINESIASVQSWYREQINGLSFQFEPATIVQGSHSFKWYQTEGAFDIERIYQDIRTSAQATADDLHRKRYLVFMEGAQKFSLRSEPYALGYSYSSLAVVGAVTPSGLLSSGKTTARYDQGYSPHALWEDNLDHQGVIAHELGHLLYGLRHEPSGSGKYLMSVDTGSHGAMQFPNTGFPDTQIAILQKSFFSK
jgi:hypothetical protein